MRLSETNGDSWDSWETNGDYYWDSERLLETHETTAESQIRDTTGGELMRLNDYWETLRPMGTHETQRDYWRLMRLRETNGDSWDSWRLLETPHRESHKTNGDLWDSVMRPMGTHETNGETHETGDQWRIMRLRETTGDSWDQWDSWDSERLLYTWVQWDSWDSQWRRMGTQVTQSD